MKKLTIAHPGWCIFLLAISVRMTAIAIIIAIHRYPLPLEYDVIASNWLDGKGFTYMHLGTVYQSFPNPLYPFLCIVLYKLFGHHPLPVLIMQSIFSGLLSVCIYRIGCFLDKQTGILAALLTISHPGIFYYDLSYLHALSMDSFLFVLIILLFMQLRSIPVLLNQVKTGAALGLQMYERGTIFFFLIPALIWLYFFSAYRYSIKRWLKKCAVIVLVMGLMTAPWVIRNITVHKEFVGICTTLSEVLWRGNNPLATGTAYCADGKPMFFGAPKEFQDKIMGLDEIGQMHAFQQAALEFIKESPARFVLLTLKKMRLFWWFSPLTGIEYHFSHMGLVKLLYVILLVLALGGICLIIRNGLRIDLVLLIFILFSAVTLGQSFFYVQQKHRWALEPLLLIFAAHAMTNLYNRLLAGVIIVRSKIIKGSR